MDLLHLLVRCRRLTNNIQGAKLHVLWLGAYGFRCCSLPLTEGRVRERKKSIEHGGKYLGWLQVGSVGGF